MDKFRILTYHRIGFPRNGRYEKLTVHAEKFAEQLNTLRLMRYDLSDLDNVCSWLKGSGKNVRRPVAADIVLHKNQGSWKYHPYFFLPSGRLYSH